MKKNIYTLLSCLTLLCFTSCQKYLDIKPYGLTIPETPEEFSALLQTRLADIEEGSDYVLLPKSSIVLDWELYGDNFEPLLAGPRVTPPYYIGDKIESSTSVKTEYERLYEIIKDCNVIIGGMPDEDSDIAHNTLATAYALRGISYYQLIRLYCEPVSAQPDQQLGVSIVTEFDMEAKAPRATLTKSMQQALSDLEKALSYNIQDNDYLFTADVVKGYLARAAFWFGKWDVARKYAKEVINKYPLLSGDSYRQMFEPGGKTGNTLIKVLYSASSGEESIALNQLRELPISNRFVSLFPEAERSKDIRYTMSVGKKRMSTKQIFSGMRSAELLLIAAESAYHMGDESEALALVNQLRENRIEDALPLTMATLPEENAYEIIKVNAKGATLTPLLSTILSERRKELFMEGDRFFELKRNGRPTFWIPKDGRRFTILPFMYTLPIPPKDLLLQEGLQQNPEYAKYTFGANNKPIQ
ncbi:RagB/SusD family nutrient uptake outer membrane protein [Porphyromonas somerae]|uniref:RagB/SusD family nutrient uptake outer membrane protein n=1 Tax=Porphyromonas somerae TaxID=322095 RepID=UPI002A7EB5F0|nr:RagB/SusD family nutrient uptake outer membrane protein [Porphyromonas somerae]MDY3885570.1 RagB/SusD family nutrient uptake outer membrane protein [Porphyromonas somerae]